MTWVQYFDQRKGEEFNAKDTMTNFTLDVIASCGFGVETNSFQNPNGEFKVMVSSQININLP